MRIERVYLGTWSQRTNLHLREVYRFLKYGQGVEGLDEAKIGALRDALDPAEAVFHNAPINVLEAVCGAHRLSISEDGIILLSSDELDLVKARGELRAFLAEKLEPALGYLFSRGAPLPKEIADIGKGGDLLAIVRGSDDDAVSRVFDAFDDRFHAHASSEGVRVMSGHEVQIVDLDALQLKEEEIAGFARDMVFFREFERQLDAYVRLHRKIWDELSEVREAKRMRYSQFPAVRADIMGYEKTLGVVRARLKQMDDILAERRAGEPKGVARILASLGMLDFNSLHATRRYVSDLWDMTDDYADGTLTLLETLYQENTQRELNALKFITLVTAITSFFGMNIAFPWDDTWHRDVHSSIAVVAIVTLSALAVYYLLRFGIQHRYFAIKKERPPEG